MLGPLRDGLLLLLAENPAAFSTRFRKVAELLQQRAATLPFDAEWYAAAYPDAVATVEAGLFTDLRQHFREQGVLCGRIGAPMPVDAPWYEQAHPAAAAEIAEGRFEDAHAHFRGKGFFEGCAASRRHQVEAAWYRARHPQAQLEVELGYYRSLQEHYNRIGHGLGFVALPQAAGASCAG